MIRYPALHAIALGVVSPAEAAATLEAMAPGSDPAVDQAIYRALRDVSWKALHSGRLDDEVAAWSNLIWSVRARIPDERVEIRASFMTLAELLGISVNFGATLSSEAVETFAFGDQLIAVIARLQSAAVQSAIVEQMKLPEHRVLHLLLVFTHAGYLQPDPRDRDGAYSLTETGRQLLQRST